MTRISHQRGVILIYALWVLVFLTILAVGGAAGIRQKIIVLQKLDERARLAHLLDAGVKYTAVHIRQTLDATGFVYTPSVKADLHNNPEIFSRLFLGNDEAQCAYTIYDYGLPTVRFGVVDEERKINLNRVDGLTLARLVERVTGLKPDDASRLAAAILDWRDSGQSDLKGFWSQDYYPNLQFPYRKKDADYETLDELLLVAGMTKEIYERLSDYVTVYGQGQVNINTAPAAVLWAMGLEDVVVEKFLAVRRGKDGVEATRDDHVFLRTFDVAAEVNEAIKLEPQEKRALDVLNLQGRLTTQSHYFNVIIEGHLERSNFFKKVRAIIAARENRIIYWKEK